MTAAPAAAPTPGPVAPAAPRAASHPPADRFAFAALLDALPSEPAKAAAPEGQPHIPKELRREKPSGEQTAHHSLLKDGALLASLPFALRAASTMEERPQDAGASPSLAPAATKALGSDASVASTAANASPAMVARLIGERTFHFSGSALAIDATFAPAVGANPSLPAGPSGESALATGLPLTGAASAQPFADRAPSSEGESALAPIVPRAGSAVANRVSPARAPGHEAARSGPTPEFSAPSAAAKAAGPTPVAPPARSSGDANARDGRQSDPIASIAQPTAPIGPFGALQSPAFAAGSSFGPGASTGSGAGSDMTPRANGSAATPVAVAQPVREIDVDLSPCGLEDVSMTMRLAGEKLSVVIRAASSHTLNLIEGARDAIADRLAAIGQALDSLIVKQTGLNTDGNTNPSMGSAEDGSGSSDWRPAQSAGEHGSWNDAPSRRGAGRDRGF